MPLQSNAAAADSIRDETIRPRLRQVKQSSLTGACFRANLLPEAGRNQKYAIMWDTRPNG